MTFQEVQNLIAAELPDNNAEVITPQKLRDTLNAILQKILDSFHLSLRVNLAEPVDKYQHNSLKVPTSRLLVMVNGMVLSANPVNDDPDPDTDNWPYPGGATPESWSHLPVTGTLIFPYDATGTLEVIIRPDNA